MTKIVTMLDAGALQGAGPPRSSPSGPAAALISAATDMRRTNNVAAERTLC